MNTLQITKTIIAKHLRSAFELRSAFLLQAFGMALNNISFLLIWIFFFQAFGTLNGWQTADVFAFLGVATIAFGSMATFFYGAVSLPHLVHAGLLDSVLLSPFSVYMRILTSEIKLSGYGDLFSGIMYLAIFIYLAQPSILQIILLLTLLIPAAIIMVNVALVTSLSAFYMTDATNFAFNLFEIFLSPSLYPSVLYPGAVKLVFIFVIPSLAVSGLPIEIVRDYQWGWYAIVWLLALCWTVFAIFLLKRAIRRYESGNMIGARL